MQGIIKSYVYAFVIKLFGQSFMIRVIFEGQ